MAVSEQSNKADLLVKEGIEFWHLGDDARAETCFVAGLTTAQANGDLFESGISSLYLGLISLKNGQPLDAAHFLEESCHTFRELESFVYLALALAGLGRANDELSNEKETQDAYTESLRISLEIHCQPSLLLVLSGVALWLARLTYQSNNSPQEAKDQLSQAIIFYTLAIEHIRDGNPADLSWFEAVYGQQIGHIAFDFAPEIVSEAQEQGRQLALWSTAEELESNLRQLGWPVSAVAKADKKVVEPLPISSSIPVHSIVPEDRQKQLVLLDKVENAWVKGVLNPLEASILNGELIALQRRRFDTAVETPWANIIETDKGFQHLIPPDESTLDIFIKTDRALLILGEPGGGKTITLIQLCRTLIGQARSQPDHPIPVVLNLSTWAEDRGDLLEWIVEELTAKYQIPRDLGRAWLGKDQLFLLLDGLDEMPSDAQPKCVTAVNHFRQSHGLTGLVVCSRRADYQSYETVLQLGGAILIQPLTREQIDSFLTVSGFQATVLTDVIEQDEALWELAESPLMLGMVRDAFSQEESDLSHLLKEAMSNPQNDLFTRRRLFFAAFVDRMFKRRRTTADYSPVNTKKKLAWLAQRMVEHNQTIFLIEQLQPSWLTSQKWRWAYLIVSRAFLGIFIGLIVWLFALTGQQLGLDLTGGLYSWAATQLHLPFMVAIFILLIFLNLLLGILVGVIDGFIYDRHQMKSDSASAERQPYWRYLATIGLMVGGATVIIFAFFGQLVFALFVGVLTAVFFMTAIGYSRQGFNYREDIQTVEALSWSNRDAVRSLLIYGFPTAIIFGLLVALLYGTVHAYTMALNFALAFFLIGGLRRGRLETNSKPNQGIRLSIRNGLSGALIFGVLSGLLYGLLFDVAVGLIVFVIMALMASNLYGGNVVMKHTVLRLILWTNGDFLLNLRPFFRQARDLIFMRRVGGGFMFTNRLLQEYFASLTPEGRAAMTTMTAVPVPTKKKTAVSASQPKVENKETAPPAPTHAPQPEIATSSVNDRYHREGLIGTGTMGKVYRGTDKLTGQTVAIKQLRAYLADEYPEAVERFIREGEALQELNHPNILSVLDLVNEKDQYLIVTEYLPGSLRELLDKEHQISVEQTIAIGLELADALARAHHLNIIHRDVKPENILLATDGTPRLADFGVAHLGRRATRLTEDGGFMGTPLYLSPENCVGEPARKRSDIWSFGVVLYEMLAGHPPFDKEQVMATMMTIVNDPLPDITQFVPAIPASLVLLLDQMLSKDPEQRIGRMRLVAAELEKIQEELQQAQ